MIIRCIFLDITLEKTKLQGGHDVGNTLEDVQTLPRNIEILPPTPSCQCSNVPYMMFKCLLWKRVFL